MPETNIEMLLALGFIILAAASAVLYWLYTINLELDSGYDIPGYREPATSSKLLAKQAIGRGLRYPGSIDIDHKNNATRIPTGDSPAHLDSGLCDSDKLRSGFDYIELEVGDHVVCLNREQQDEYRMLDPIAAHQYLLDVLYDKGRGDGKTDAGHSLDGLQQAQCGDPINMESKTGHSL